jgi:uncharacterized membrane protein YqjE
MFQKVRRVRSALQLLRERLPHYGFLFNHDLNAFRAEVIKVSVGAGVAAVTGLLFACFLCVAVIVSAWDTRYRILAAWAVCAVWAVFAFAGLIYARRAVAGPLPFRSVSEAALRDYSDLVALVEPAPESHSES